MSVTAFPAVTGSWEMSSLCTRLPKSSPLPSEALCSKSLTIFVVSAGSSPVLPHPSQTGGPNAGDKSWRGLANSGQSGQKSLFWLCQTCGCQCNLFILSGMGTYFWLTVSPESFSAGLSGRGNLPAWLNAQSCVTPCAELCSSPPWTPQGATSQVD